MKCLLSHTREENRDLLESRHSLIAFVTFTVTSAMIQFLPTPCLRIEILCLFIFAQMKQNLEFWTPVLGSKEMTLQTDMHVNLHSPFVVLVLQAGSSRAKNFQRIVASVSTFSLTSHIRIFLIYCNHTRILHSGRTFTLTCERHAKVEPNQL